MSYIWAALKDFFKIRDETISSEITALNTKINSVEETELRKDLAKGIRTLGIKMEECKEAEVKIVEDKMKDQAETDKFLKRTIEECKAREAKNLAEKDKEHALEISSIKNSHFIAMAESSGRITEITKEKNKMEDKLKNVLIELDIVTQSERKLKTSNSELYIQNQDLMRKSQDFMVKMREMEKQMTYQQEQSILKISAAADRCDALLRSIALAQVASEKLIASVPHEASPVIMDAILNTKLTTPSFNELKRTFYELDNMKGESKEEILESLTSIESEVKEAKSGLKSFNEKLCLAKCASDKAEKESLNSIKTRLRNLTVDEESKTLVSAAKVKQKILDRT